MIHWDQPQQGRRVRQIGKPWTSGTVDGVGEEGFHIDYDQPFEQRDGYPILGASVREAGFAEYETIN